MFTEEEIQTIESTYRMVSISLDSAGETFYHNLFAMAPELRPMFHTPVVEQGRKLMQILGMAVASLHVFENLQPALSAMGQRHLNYGVKDEHYDIVGECLLMTLAQLLGDEFTEEANRAWYVMYQHIVNMMRQGQLQNN